MTVSWLPQPTPEWQIHHVDVYPPPDRYGPALRFYREGDKIVIATDSEIVHLDPETARSIGLMLCSAAADIKSEKRRIAALSEAFGS